MGTATMSNTKPLPMEKEKKPNIIKIISTLFQKKEKKPEVKKSAKPEKREVIREDEPIKVTDVATLLKEFEKVGLKEKSDEFNKFSYTRDTRTSEDKNKDVSLSKETNEDPFTRESDARCERVGSHSSQDSGYSEPTEESKDKQTDLTDDVIKNLEGLHINKEKKTQTVVIGRGPSRNKVGDIVPPTHPYNRDVNNYKQVTQVPFVNPNTFTGGQVFVKPNTDLIEINQALSTIENNVQNFPQSTEQQCFLFQTAQEFITEDTVPASELPEDILHDCIEMLSENYDMMPKVVDPLDEFNSTLLNFELEGYQTTYPTPPYSENVSSPLSVDLGSPQLNHSEYTLSPDRSSPIYNSDLEKYQDISADLENYQVPDTYQDAESAVPEKQKRSKTPSGSLMTMKQYKDLQKELSAEFSKFECCQMSRKPCKEIFEEHAKKLKAEERKGLCVKLSQLDTNAAYGVLQHILLSLSTGSKEEDLQCALFSLLCERVLAQRPALFLGDFGLRLLKSAALRCYRRPLFTRYLVQCIRTALRLNPTFMEGKDNVFHETDALGDTLVTACARAGDACASVLNELVTGAPALFRLAHANTDGYTALHVACSLHSAEAPRLRTVHVLLEHGKADLWGGDVKGGDTALHLAVNSSTCDLRMVMVVFRHVERARWRQLAHAPNRSSVTPLEYARSQTKSISRPYPQEVLDFLKKCR